jgi:hypothetical protein
VNFKLRILVASIAALIILVIPAGFVFMGYQNQTESSTLQAEASSTPSVLGETKSKIKTQVKLGALGPESLKQAFVDIPYEITTDPTTKTFLTYEINDLPEVTLPLDATQDSFNLSLLPRTNRLTYSIKVQDEDGTVTRYPDDKIIINTRYFEDLTGAISVLEQQSGDKIHISLLDSYGNEFHHKADEVIGVLSLIKVPVMVETFNQIDQGKIAMTDQVSRYGYTGTVESALQDMIHVSSNEATGALIQHVGGIEPINTTIQNLLGDPETPLYLDHTPGYGTAENWKRYNEMNTMHMAKLTQMIHNGEVINQEYSRAMLDLMEGTDDYLNIADSKGLKSIKQKTGYYPPIMYGVTGVIETDWGEEYTVAIMIDNWETKKSIFDGQMQQVIEILNAELQNTYYEE